MHDFLSDQVCLVTGGTQGIGWALSQALADHGAQVYACGRTLANLRRAEGALPDLPWGDAIHLLQCDVTNRKALEAWIQAVHVETGRIDVLVNNAAFVRWQDVDSMTVEEALRTMRVSYDGLVVAIKAVLPLMKTAGRGHIVNMGSMTSQIFVPGSSAAYAAAKAAIDAYTLMLQIELENSPVNATLVRLATVAGTDFFKKHVPAARMSPLTRFIPALTPTQVARAVVRAIYRKQKILTLPGYMHVLGIIYQIMPGISRRLAKIGGRNERDYGRVDWRYPDKK
jgi:NAD(P)-dependent dehydrogenase (short-subunit alcohol dehydrogenase family)